MITENPSRRPVSAGTAAEWLRRLHELRAECECFGTRFSELLQRAVSGGLPFPDAAIYVESTAELERQRGALLEEIRGLAWMPESVGWELPAQDLPLPQLEESLSDLQSVSQELERQQREFLPRYCELAAAAARLTARDEAVMPQLEPIRQLARRLQHAFEHQPWVVAERDIQEQAAGLQSLFELLAEAQRPLPGGSGMRREGLSLAELEQQFVAVEVCWGQRTALAALRGLIFTASYPGCELRAAGGVSLGDRGAVSCEVVSEWRGAAGGGGGAGAALERAESFGRPFSLPEPVSLPVSVSPPATPEQLRGLEMKFRGGTSSSLLSRKPAATASNVVPVSAVPRGTSTAELGGLAACSAALRNRAVKLWPGVREVVQHGFAKSPEQLRALGWQNLSGVIELAAELLAERSRVGATFRNELTEILNLTAEAQNAVRVEAEGREAIAEQEQVFHWLRVICHAQAEGVRIERFMRRTDRANPAGNADVSIRLQALQRRVRDHILQERLLRELEGHVRSLRRDPGGESATDLWLLNRGVWQSIDATIRELLGVGVHENDGRVRELLLPVVELLPEPEPDPGGDEGGESEGESEESGAWEGDEFSAEFTRVLNSLVAHIDRSPAAGRQELEQETEDLRYVRERLSGRSIAIVGGVCKPHAAARIRKALQLEELRWLSAGKSDRVSQFETDIRGMSLVVLITKLIGHKHNEIREFCRAREIPWVQTRIQGGYSVNQLARLIREQASQHLDAGIR